MRDLKWFKEEIASSLIGYEIQYRFYVEGDFGSLNQVSFDRTERGGEVDFWSSGWLSICFVDYINGDILINVFLEPHQEKEKELAFQKLRELLL